MPHRVSTVHPASSRHFLPLCVARPASAHAGREVCRWNVSVVPTDTFSLLRFRPRQAFVCRRLGRFQAHHRQRCDGQRPQAIQCCVHRQPTSIQVHLHSEQRLQRCTPVSPSSQYQMSSASRATQRAFVTELPAIRVTELWPAPRRVLRTEWNEARRRQEERQPIALPIRRHAPPTRWLTRSRGAHAVCAETQWMVRRR